MYCKGLLVILLALVVLYVEAIEITSRASMNKYCSSVGTHRSIPQYGITCCKNQFLIPTIIDWSIADNSSTLWTECAVASNNTNKNYLSIMWRIYICMLYKSVPKGQKTISFINFSEIMTAKYPETIKEDIKKQINFIVSNNTNATKQWLTSQINFTDYKNIEKLRAEYFNVEKKVCGIANNVPLGEENGKEWGKCSKIEETTHRSGTCCHNITVPIQEYVKVFKPKNCDVSLSKLLDNLMLNDTRDTVIVNNECALSCYLIQKKIITIDELIKLNAKDDDPSADLIVKELTPVYYSQYVHGLVQNFVKKYIKHQDEIKKVASDLSFQIKGNLKIENIYGCISHNWIQHLVASCESKFEYTT